MLEKKKEHSDILVEGYYNLGNKLKSLDPLIIGLSWGVVRIRTRR